jgi:hypothetical protein
MIQVKVGHTQAGEVGALHRQQPRPLRVLLCGGWGQAPYRLEYPLLAAGQPGIRQDLDAGQQRGVGQVGVV